MEQPPRKRRRPALSCIECRRRKIKCDRNDPCAHCVSLKTRCVHRAYHEPVTQQPPPQDIPVDMISGTSTTALSPLSPARGRIDPHVSTQHDQPLGLSISVALPAQQANSDESLHQGRPQEAEPDFQKLVQRVQRLEQVSVSSPLSGLAETGRDILERQAGLQDSQIVLNKTRILRWSHWMGTAQEVLSCILRP
jgi:hypothetical protein